MSTKGDRDATTDKLLRTSLRGRPAGEGGDCPPADVLAAFVEGSLAASERQTAEAHLAACERCQETLAALSEMPETLRAAREPRRAWPALRWLAPAAAVLTLLIIYVAVGSRGGRVAENVALKSPAPPSPVEQIQANPAPGSEPAPSVVARTELPGVALEAPKREGRTGEHGASHVAPPAKLVSENAPSARPVPPPAPPRRADSAANAAPAPPPLADNALDAKVAGRETRGQVADASAAKPAATPPAMAAAGGAAFRVGAPAQQTMAKAAAAPQVADAKERRIDALAESVAVAAPGMPVVFASRDGLTRWRLEPGGVISRSSDAGATWRSMQSGASVELVTGAAPSARVAWVVGRGGIVLRTIDGEHWSRCSFPEAADLVAVDAKDDRAATVITRDGRRFTTSDAGVTWTIVR